MVVVVIRKMVEAQNKGMNNIPYAIVITMIVIMIRVHSVNVLTMIRDCMMATTTTIVTSVYTC
mgnify:FL=1